MKAKYLKYWKDIPYLFLFAFMLDPRAKSPGLCNLLQLFTEVLGIEYSTYFRDVKNSLNDLYIKYEEKYARVHPRQSPQAPKAGISCHSRSLSWARLLLQVTHHMTNHYQLTVPLVNLLHICRRTQLTSKRRSFTYLHGGNNKMGHIQCYPS